MWINFIHLYWCRRSILCWSCDFFKIRPPFRSKNLLEHRNRAFTWKIPHTQSSHFSLILFITISLSKSISFLLLPVFLHFSSSFSFLPISLHHYFHITLTFFFLSPFPFYSFLFFSPFFLFFLPLYFSSSFLLIASSPVPLFYLLPHPLFPFFFFFLGSSDI